MVGNHLLKPPKTVKFRADPSEVVSPGDSGNSPFRERKGNVSPMSRSPASNQNVDIEDTSMKAKEVSHHLSENGDKKHNLTKETLVEKK